MTLMHNVVTKSGRDDFLEQYATLDEHERSMFAELEQDLEFALLKCKPLLAIFKRRGGQYTFVILREGIKFSQEFTRSHKFQSSLTLDKDGCITMETIGKLIGLLKLKTGLRINGLERHLPCIPLGIDEEYYTYHFDLEGE